MFGIGVEKKKVGRVNERYHLNPHIDQFQYPALKYEEPSVEYIAQVLEDLIIRSKKSFVFKGKLDQLIYHVSSKVDNDKDLQLLGEFIGITKMEGPERKERLIAFLKKAKALEKE